MTQALYDPEAALQWLRDNAKRRQQLMMIGSPLPTDPPTYPLKVRAEDALRFLNTAADSGFAVYKP